MIKQWHQNLSDHWRWWRFLVKVVKSQRHLQPDKTQTGQPKQLQMEVSNKPSPEKTHIGKRFFFRKALWKEHVCQENTLKMMVISFRGKFKVVLVDIMLKIPINRYLKTSGLLLKRWMPVFYQIKLIKCTHKTQSWSYLLRQMHHSQKTLREWSSHLAQGITPIIIIIIIIIIIMDPHHAQFSLPESRIPTPFSPPFLD